MEHCNGSVSFPSSTQNGNQKRRSLLHLDPKEKDSARKQRVLDSARMYRNKREAEDKLLQQENTVQVVEHLVISGSDLRPLTQTERNTLADIITVLARFRRVARQLEADQMVTMSCTPRLLLELYESLCVMFGSLSVCSSGFYEQQAGSVSTAID